jgi:xanthine dehydrogenase YagS FAD-binding subunit
MKPFAYARPETHEEARALLSPTARPKGGGMDLLDLAKGGIATPATMVDLSRIPLYGKVGSAKGGGLLLGGGATLAALAASAEAGKACPALVDAASEAATPQVRHRATVAGNLLQRPRCVYFRDPYFDCLKRGGKTCPSREGNHEEGAIFGNGKCCAVHPSNLAVALSALGGQADFLVGRDGQEEIHRLAQLDDSFWVAPEEDPLREARVGPGELLVHVAVPSSPASAYEEVNWKQSFDWASASAAVALKLAGGKVEDARVFLGFVAPIPLRSKAAEDALRGKTPDEAAAAAAGKAATRGATPLPGNAHKVRHLEIAVRRAVLRAAARGR